MMGPLMKTPLGKVRGLGAARSGTEHFWLSRVTSLAEIPLEIAALVIVVKLVGADYNEAVAILGAPVTAVILLLWILNATIHMRLGMQVIIEDYVHHEGAKVAALLANVAVMALLGTACVVAVLKVSLGS